MTMSQRNEMNVNIDKLCLLVAGFPNNPCVVEGTAGAICPNPVDGKTLDAVLEAGCPNNPVVTGVGAWLNRDLAPKVFVVA